MATRQKLYDFMKKSDLNKRIVGTAIALMVIGGLYVVGSAVGQTIDDSQKRQKIAEEIQRVKDADPKEYVDFYSVTVGDTSIGELPDVTLCRKLGNGNVTIEAVRTFIRYDNGKEKQVLERGFEAAIEKSSNGTDCAHVDLIGQPQVAGQYYIDTNYCFNVKVHDKQIKKCDSYKSNDYEMTDDIAKLKQRLDQLQKEYDRRLQGSPPSSDPSEGQTNGLQSQSSVESSEPSSSSAQQPTNPSSGQSRSNNSGGSSATPEQEDQDDGLTIDLPLLPPFKLGGN